MAKTDLTAQRLRELLHYDPDTGIFTRLVRSNNSGPIGGRAGGKLGTAGYRGISADGIQYLEHRLALFYMNGEWPKQHVDHINGNKKDNRIANLRDVSALTNSQNRTKQRGVSGFLGVQRNRERWQACIQVNGKTICLGTRDDPAEAHELYMAAKRQLHPGFVE